MIASYTRLSTFQDCPRKYFFMYCLHLKKPLKSPNLRIGAATHKFLEHWYRTPHEALEERKAKATAAMVEELKADNTGIGEIEEQVAGTTKAVIEGYLRRYGPVEKEFTVIEPEMEGLAPLGDEHQLRFRIDAVINYRDQLWILEDKTSAYLGEAFLQSFMLHHQVLTYVYGTSYKLKRPIAGALLNLMRKPTKTISAAYDRQTVVVRPSHIRNMLTSFYNVATDIESRDPKDIDHWPQRTQACFKGRFRCDFWEICLHEHPAEPKGLYVLDERRAHGAEAEAKLKEEDPSHVIDPPATTLEGDDSKVKLN